MKSLFSILVIGLFSFEAYSACQVNVYFTNTIASSKQFYNNPNCGKVTRYQKWPARCVNKFVRGANWYNSLSYNGHAGNYGWVGGQVSYFLVEYPKNKCRYDYEVNTNDAILIGTRTVWNGRKKIRQKLYGVMNWQHRFNDLVNVTRRIWILQK